VEEASDGTAKGMVQKAPFSFGAGGSSTEAPPSGFALFSSSWAFGSGSSSGSGSTTAISTTANATTFSNSNNTDSSSFQLFGSQGSTVFSTSPAFSQPPLPSSTQFQEVSVKTGEEQEKVVFGGDATLFEFADGSWKERGKGEMKVNVPEEKTSKPRLVMRSKGNYKLLLNAGLFADMKLAAMDSRGVTFACVNSVVEGKSGLTTYAVKFRDSTSAASFRDAVEKHKTGPQQQPQQEEALKAPENSPSAVHESS
jgi:Ran-binding protein 3